MILYNIDGRIFDTSLYTSDKEIEKILNMPNGSIYRLKNNKMNHSNNWYVDKSKIPITNNNNNNKNNNTQYPQELHDNYTILFGDVFQTQCKKCKNISNQSLYMLKKKNYKCFNCEELSIINEITKNNYEILNNKRDNGKWNILCKKCNDIQYITITALRNKNYKCSNCELKEQISEITNTKKYNILEQSPLKLECINCGFITNKSYSVLKKQDFKCSECGSNEQISNIQNSFSILNYKDNDLKTIIINILKKYNIPESEYIVNKPLNKNGTYINEIDIYLPNYNLAIEYNGLAYHSTPNCYGKTLNKNLHQIKYDKCQQIGIHLFYFNTYDIQNKIQLIESMIVNKLHKTPTKIFARKCNIRHVDNEEAKLFLNKNHLQGSRNSFTKLGLYYDDKLIAYMAFDFKHELVRYCQEIFTNVIGGFNKLLKYYIKTYKPQQIYTFSDNMYSSGHVYKNNGFQILYKQDVKYKYVKKGEYNKLYPRQYFMKNNIKSGNNPLNLIFYDNRTEEEIANKNNYYRYYDAGKVKWIYHIIQNN